MWGGIATIRLVTAVAIITAAVPALGATFHLDAVGGDDRASGESPKRAWKTMTPANARRFEPGDRLLINAGRGRKGRSRCMAPARPSRRSAVSIERKSNPRYGHCSRFGGRAPGLRAVLACQGRIAEEQSLAFCSRCRRTEGLCQRP